MTVLLQNHKTGIRIQNFLVNDSAQVRDSTGKFRVYTSLYPKFLNAYCSEFKNLFQNNALLFKMKFRKNSIYEPFFFKLAKNKILIEIK